MPDPLSTVEAYQTYIYILPERYRSILRSTLVYIPSGALFGRLEGLLVFQDDMILCVQEYLNFELGVIVRYGYEVSQSPISPSVANFPPASDYCRANYHHKSKLYWYDSFPHPHNPTLASTHPHHKHVSPDIKHNRIPAPGLGFTRPNLPFLIEEIEQAIVRLERSD